MYTNSVFLCAFQFTLFSSHSISNNQSGNTEQGKCRLTNEYLFFLFLIGCWYYEKKNCIYKNDLFLQVLIRSLQFPVRLVFPDIALIHLYTSATTTTKTILRFFDLKNIQLFRFQGQMLFSA